MRELLETRLNEHIAVFNNILKDNDLKDVIITLGDVMVNSLKNGGRIILCGNGGSASDAQHIAAEFVGRFQKERKAYDAEALTVNTSTLTSVGNDYGYVSIFARQVEAKGRTGDILIGISTSGTSANVVEALKKGRELGLVTAMLKGAKGNNELSEFCDYVISVPSDVTARVQEGHIFIGHMLAEIVEEAL